MDADTVRLASVGCPLSSVGKRLLDRDLVLHPDDILVDTLRSLLQRGEWIEQETLLQELPRACEVVTECLSSNVSMKTCL
jgi:hypothetical protein